jgi:hypothetical protein
VSIDRSGCTSHLHGDDSAYRYGCRCPDAREASRLRRKRAREGRSVPGCVNHLGTMRRLQALAALGWPLDALAAELDMSPGHVKDLRCHGRGDVVYRTTAARVAAVYERLSGTPGSSERVRRYAARQDWPSPMAWDEVDIDDPAARAYGRRVEEPQTYLPAVELAERAERLRAELEAAAPYSGQPFSWRAVADRLGVKEKTLEKARERARRRRGSDRRIA